jgi:hypothetical protein
VSATLSDWYVTVLGFVEHVRSAQAMAAKRWCRGADRTAAGDLLMPRLTTPRMEN